jgi:hypothetical protein
MFGPGDEQHPALGRERAVVRREALDLRLDHRMAAAADLDARHGRAAAAHPAAVGRDAGERASASSSAIAWPERCSASAPRAQRGEQRS